MPFVAAINQHHLAKIWMNLNYTPWPGRELASRLHVFVAPALRNHAERMLFLSGHRSNTAQVIATGGLDNSGGFFMDRRQFLQLSSMAALSLYASRLRGSQMGSSAARQGPAQKVTILGAGVAG